MLINIIIIILIKRLVFFNYIIFFIDKINYLNILLLFIINKFFLFIKLN